MKQTLEMKIRHHLRLLRSSFFYSFFLILLAWIMINLDNEGTKGNVIGYWIAIIGFILLTSWIPCLIIHVNYLINNWWIKRIKIISDKLYLFQRKGNQEKIYSFSEIEKIKRIRHFAYKKAIENEEGFSDKIENSLNKRLFKQPWSRYEYIEIIFKDGFRLILTSLMYNFKNELIKDFNFENEFKRFQIIKKK